MSTSYTNLGGSGNRRFINVVPSAGLGSSGDPNYLVGGGYGNGYFWNTGASNTGQTIQFQFTTTQNGTQSVIIDEAKWYQNTSTSEGIWQWQGSNDGVSWTNVGSQFTLGGSTTTTITALNGNTTAYGYYQMLGISGSLNSTPYLQGIDFHIDGMAFICTFPPTDIQQMYFTQVPTFPAPMQQMSFTVQEQTNNILPVSPTFSFGWNNQISLSGNPVPVAQVLKGATQFVIYSETIGAQLGTPPYTFSVYAGSLPTGLSLNSSTGVISGTPTTLGTYSFTIQATDNLLATGTQPFSITVAAPAQSNYGYFN